VLRSAAAVFCGRQYPHAGGASHAHKVNLQINETRNGMRTSENRLQTICAINGTAVRRYELALAADHIMLVDDGSSAVSLPELPLRKCPGTGGLTRVPTSARSARHADFFCTNEEGEGKARACGWSMACPARNSKRPLLHARRNSR
jgi:benzoyl-CoA-dihydrodiol lyase